MARVFAVRVLSWLSITIVAVQVILRMGNYPGIVILLTVVARSGFVKHYDSVLVAGAKAKTVTNNLPILSVLGFRAFLVMLSRNCLFDRCLDIWILD
jgi:recombinational DNA repair protein RecT